MSGDDRLRLIALDQEDLAVVSAHVQDAVVKVQDLTWLPSEKRFVMALNRFVWEAAPRGLFRRRDYQRRRAALHFERVDGVQVTGIDKDRLEDVLSILALRFDPGEGPSGHVSILFAGNATLRLSVECMEAQITDLGPAWSTAHAPHHPA